MKLVFYKSALLILITLSMTVVFTPLSAQVYKTVDKDGNVTFTDQPPKDGSEPIDLAPLSVIEAPTYEQPVKADKEDGEDGKQMSLRFLRKQYADFAIVAPQSEESVWNPDTAITVAWNTRYKLQEGMQVTVLIDGQPQAKTTDQIIPVVQLDRGEHRAEAILTDGKNRKIATAEPVTFFVRRPGLYNRPRVAPHGGG